MCLKRGRNVSFWLIREVRAMSLVGLLNPPTADIRGPAICLTLGSGTRAPARRRVPACGPGGAGRLGCVPMAPLTRGGRASAPYCAASR